MVWTYFGKVSSFILSLSLVITAMSLCHLCCLFTVIKLANIITYTRLLVYSHVMITKPLLLYVVHVLLAGARCQHSIIILLKRKALNSSDVLQYRSST